MNSVKLPHFKKKSVILGVDSCNGNRPLISDHRNCRFQNSKIYFSEKAMNHSDEFIEQQQFLNTYGIDLKTLMISLITSQIASLSYSQPFGTKFSNTASRWKVFIVFM